ncbi:3-dehydroquinate dehydratase (3-dehydroquinase) [Friedmanniomyces endolithicus]|nr:3-dehydroquinate dehydratase (3-dehydroquinase) [Friedmanniomyces endolithicus]KAK1808604.1 3-dehydroquinate dehydratase (3-dehydroquinase) [Friedmanniomyces endolithicus]
MSQGRCKSGFETRGADETTEKTVDWRGMLSTLGSSPRRRYEWSREMRDLEKAIDTARQVLQSTPLDYRVRADRLNNLTSSLLTFPRQDGLCTRFATEITLEHADTALHITASIIPAASRDERATGNLRAYSRDLTDFQELPHIGKMSRVNNGFMTPVSHPALLAKAAPGQVSAAETRKVLGIVGEIQAKKMFLFGNPIGQSRSPALHNALFQDTGLPHEYGLFQTDSAEDINSVIRSAGFGGGSVTIPLKLDVMPLLDHMDEAASTIGAVNTIVPSEDAAGKTILTGYNTDWQGMVLSLRNAGALGSTCTLKQARMVVGGGGTARAAIYALKEMGYAPIYLVGRNKQKLAALSEIFPANYGIQLLSAEEEAQALLPEQHPTVAIGTIPGDSPIEPGMREILCTIFGAHDSAVAADATAGSAASRRVLLEMAYKPAITSLMQLAQNSGWKTVPGLEALVGQGVHQFRLWTGITPVYGRARAAVMGTV